MQLDRQAARAERDGELVGAVDGEAAADPGGAAEDRLGDVRGRDGDVVEDDRERLVDVLLGHPRKAAAAIAVETDVDVGSSVFIEPLRGVGDHVAGNDRAALDRDSGVRPAFGIGQDLAADRRPPGLELLRPDAAVDQLELEPRGAADQGRERCRVLEAGNLDEDAVRSLANDRRLERAERIDAAIDDVAGHDHRLADGAVEPTRRLAHRDAVALDADVPVALAAAAALFARLPDGRVALGGIADQKGELAAAGRDLRDLDAGGAHFAADDVLHRLEPLA